MAQSQVRIEFGNGEYNETNFPPVQLFNDYFSGGMSGIVFQELRESRALAYSVGAVYSTAAAKGEQNIMIGAIGCQADKTTEALDAFLDLFENSGSARAVCRNSRFGHQPLPHRKLSFREIIGAVRSWERLEVPIDPASRASKKSSGWTERRFGISQKNNSRAGPNSSPLSATKTKSTWKKSGKTARLRSWSLKKFSLLSHGVREDALSFTAAESRRRVCSAKISTAKTRYEMRQICSPRHSRDFHRRRNRPGQARCLPRPAGLDAR